MNLILQKDWVGWSTKLQESVDLGVGGTEFQRFAVEKVSGSVFSLFLYFSLFSSFFSRSGEGEWKCYFLTRFLLSTHFSWRWRNGRTLPSTGWRPLPSFSWFTTNISSNDPEIQLRRIITFMGLEADEERFSCMVGRRFGRLSGFSVFLFFSQVWEVLAQKHSFEESCLLGEHSCKGEAHVYMFSNRLQHIHYLGTDYFMILILTTFCEGEDGDGHCAEDAGGGRPPSSSSSPLLFDMTLK